MDRDRKEILLKEYEICEQDNNSASANNWTVIGIFTSISVGSLAVIIFKIIDIQGGNYERLSLIFVIIWGLMAIIVINFLKSWTQRVSFLLGNNNLRMREIEKSLGMNKSIRIWELDNWDDMPEEVRKRIIDSWEMLCSKCEGKETCNKTEEECEELKKDILKRCKCTLPDGFRPPHTGRNILSDFFNSLLAIWGLFVITTLGILIFKLVAY